MRATHEACSKRANARLARSVACREQPFDPFFGFLFLFYFNWFLFLNNIQNIKIKLIRYVNCGINMYYLIWWAKIVSLVMRRVRFTSLKFDLRTDVAIIGPTDEPKIWLTIVFAYCFSFVFIWLDGCLLLISFSFVFIWIACEEIFLHAVRLFFFPSWEVISQ